MSKRVISFIIALLLVIASIIFYQTPSEPEIIEYRIRISDQPDNDPSTIDFVIKASYNIIVERNGEIIYNITKQDDPLSIQWFKLIANMLFGFVRDNITNPKTIDGTVNNWLDLETVHTYATSCYTTCTYTQVIRNPLPVIALGDGSSPSPSFYDYGFSIKVSDYGEITVTNTSTEYQVLITKSFTITESFTLTEVGLMIEGDVSTGSGDPIYGRFLVAHDVVDPPVSLVEDDSVTVTYTITIPYNQNGVFTKNFYGALIDYFLGYAEGSGDRIGLLSYSGETAYMDTAHDGVDPEDYQNPGDYVDGEYIFIEVGTGASIYNPFNTYALGNLYKRMRIDDPQFFNEIIYDESSFKIHLIASFSFTEDVEITEIGVSYYTDLNQYRFVDPGYILLMYFPLDSPITVKAGEGLHVEITIEFLFS